MKKVIIMGGSGVGMIAASIIRKNGDATVLGFINDVIPVGTEIGKYGKIPVIGTTKDIHSFLEDEETYIFNGFIGMTREQEVYESIRNLKIPNEKFTNIIDKSAIIPGGFCKIGRGVMMAPLSQLSPDTTISDQCVLLPNSFVGHDSYLEENVSLATNAVVGANVRIGKGCHVGSNATIREKINIGAFSLIGMGAVVINDVPENSIVVGNPAKVIRKK
jgi:acetyltransferase EpsM